MAEYILSRQILVAMFCLHSLLFYFGSTVKIDISAKTYNTCFLTEVLVLTAYIVYTCITEPFYSGITAGILGYIAVYLTILLSYVALKHWTIVPDKIYDFHPEKVKYYEIEDNTVGGYISESGKKIFVCVDNEEFCKTAEKSDPVRIKYLEWKNFTAHFCVV